MDSVSEPSNFFKKQISELSHNAPSALVNGTLSCARQGRTETDHMLQPARRDPAWLATAKARFSMIRLNSTRLDSTRLGSAHQSPRFNTAARFGSVHSVPPMIQDNLVFLFISLFLFLPPGAGEQRRISICRNWCGPTRSPVPSAASLRQNKKGEKPAWVNHTRDTRIWIPLESQKHELICPSRVSLYRTLHNVCRNIFLINCSCPSAFAECS